MGGASATSKKTRGTSDQKSLKLNQASGKLSTDQGNKNMMCCNN